MGFDDLVSDMDSALLSPVHGFGVTVQWLDDGQWHDINATQEQVSGQYGPQGRQNQTVSLALEVSEQDAARIAQRDTIRVDGVDHQVDHTEYPDDKLPRLHLVLPLPDRGEGGEGGGTGHRWQSR